MNHPVDFLDEPDLTTRLASCPQVVAMDAPMRDWLSRCLRQWGGVGLDEATWGDLRRASRAVAADMAERSPAVTELMAGRDGFSTTELLDEMRKAQRS